MVANLRGLWAPRRKVAWQILLLTGISLNGHLHLWWWNEGPEMCTFWSDQAPDSAHPLHLFQADPSTEMQVRLELEGKL